jgi:putative transcriptional regulator
MAEIKHHLTDALMMAYAAGSLPEAFDVVVATHVSLCDECRARMHAFDAVGGALVTQSETVAMGADSLAATLAMIADRAPEPRPATPALRPDRVFPAPLADYVGGDLDAVRWRRVGGGVSDAILRTQGRATVRLLRIPGGVAVPDHGHRGMELTLVLKGAFRDETDHFGAGDVEVADDSTVHKPVAVPGEDCICLAATDAPLRFNALIPRIAQSILRI